jgi:hypothetical protein
MGLCGLQMDFKCGMLAASDSFPAWRAVLSWGLTTQEGVVDRRMSEWTRTGDESVASALLLMKRIRNKTQRWMDCRSTIVLL